MLWRRIALAALFASAVSVSAHAQVKEFGDEDLLGFGYPEGANPKQGAQLQGLKPGVVSKADQHFSHPWPVVVNASDPAGTKDYPGTDQMFVGSKQTASLDGYAQSDPKPGPQIILLDYSDMLSAGATIKTFTLGIAADDFQFPVLGQRFTASINDTVDKALTDELNKLDLTGPQTQFFTIGIDPAVLNPNEVLKLTIDEGGNGGDGWAIDFLTIGLTTGAETARANPRSPYVTPVRNGALEERLDKLTARAAAAKNGIDLLREQQRELGHGFPPDINATEERMETEIRQAQSAFQSGDAPGTATYLDLAEEAIDKLEKFLRP